MTSWYYKWKMSDIEYLQQSYRPVLYNSMVYNLQSVHMLNNNWLNVVSDTVAVCCSSETVAGGC